MTYLKGLFVIMCCVAVQCIYSQDIPSNKIIETHKLVNYLKPEVKVLLSKNGIITEAALAQYFRDKFSERYFYDWKNFDAKFNTYNTIYADAEDGHAERALDHISKFADSTNWLLPFNYLNGNAVNAYALRHLARQHKMVDIAFQYYYTNKNQTYLNYFKNQLKSLNAALENGDYEKVANGNGVYESFRAGYRVLNWLEIHNMFLGQNGYSDDDQLTTIATLLQHGAKLIAENPNFVPGNHQTRGMSALAMISILLRDFKGTDVWYNYAMKLLEEHMNKEINDDGFQFERSVHYHISDIENYFYVYQLAKISDIQVSKVWQSKLKSLFITLTKIAYPDKSAPVLQDDTNNPWAEKNDISKALTLGYLLFKDPVMGYFASPILEPHIFWFVTNAQLDLLNNIKSEKPTYKSLSFPTTGYYIMRKGWNLADNMMIISAGLSKEKPDHQHGDMLGVQAMFNGKTILPNYQVRYSLPDYEFFKNSMVKNVALVDNELQGKLYGSNKGGSGFGKFAKLPKPNVIAWNSNKNIELFIGSHNGFEDVGVQYNRQVINVKNYFWIVKDNFKALNEHTYKQVWQGHFSVENQPNLIREVFDDATGCDIYQLHKIDTLMVSGSRGKQWSVLSKKGEKIFSFISVIFPYIGYENRINELETNPELKGWKTDSGKWETEGVNSTALTKNNESIFFGIKKLSWKNILINFSKTTDVYLKQKDDALTLELLGYKEVKLEINGVKSCKLNNQIITKSAINLKPGNQINCSY